jgi:hypothetical protein
MDAVAAYFEQFNAKQLEGMPKLFGPGYTYAEPLYPEPRDAAGHVALMRRIAESFPNRRMDVRRRVPGASGEAVEAVVWRPGKRWGHDHAGVCLRGRYRPGIRPDQPNALLLRTTSLMAPMGAAPRATRGSRSLWPAALGPHP